MSELIINVAVMAVVVMISSATVWWIEKGDTSNWDYLPEDVSRKSEYAEWYADNEYR